MLNSTFTIPARTAGGNDHWIASGSTEWNDFASELYSDYLSGSFDGIRVVEICLKGSGAVSFIDDTQCIVGDCAFHCDIEYGDDEYNCYCDDLDCYPCPPKK